MKNGYVKDNKEGAKTTFHMLELHDLGNSFLFQLKNGHFIISDGGRKTDLPYLLDYLGSLVPEGEKPVIEGWFYELLWTEFISICRERQHLQKTRPVVHPPSILILRRLR